MPRPRNPLSKRNRNETFTGAEVSRLVEKLAASKKARVVRERGEFNTAALAALVRAPLINSGAFAWSLDAILSARDAQMAGSFSAPARLAESFNTDDALFTARSVRLAPVQSLSVKVTAGRGPKADSIAAEAEALFGDKGIAWSSDTENTVRAQLVDHGVAFAAITWQPRADGSRWDLVISAWPIEFVRWDALANCYVTRVRRPDADPEPTARDLHPGALGAIESGLEPIIHGNGRWIVFKKSELLPHRSADATLLPAALLWPCHAFANRDWRKGSAIAGNAKVVGEMEPGTALTDSKGEPTPEATAFLTLLQAIASQDSPYGIRPFGSKTEILANPSANAWEVFAKLSESSERAAARIYLGTDGVLGAQGGAPGVDISALFGVATSKVQSDLACIQRGLQTAIEIWTAINFGDSKQAPTREYKFPDPDLSRVREDFGKRNAAFLADVKAAKEAGFKLTKEWVASIAEKHGVPVPELADVATAPSTAPANDAAPPAPASAAG